MVSTKKYIFPKYDLRETIMTNSENTQGAYYLHLFTQVRVKGDDGNYYLSDVAYIDQIPVNIHEENIYDIKAVRKCKENGVKEFIKECYKAICLLEVDKDSFLFRKDMNQEDEKVRLKSL